MRMQQSQLITIIKSVPEFRRNPKGFTYFTLIHIYIFSISKIIFYKHEGSIEDELIMCV